MKIIFNERGKFVSIDDDVIGRDGENLQETIVCAFEGNTFINGVGRLEYQIGDNKYYVLMEKDDVKKTYSVPVKNVMTKKGTIDLQLVITETAIDEEIPIFKSQVVKVYCARSLNAEGEAPEEYPAWIDTANEKIAEFETMDIDIEAEDDAKTVVITRKDGSQKRATVSGGGGIASWGNITGDIDTQTDLKNKLDAKQDTLVSGTNIKTINNESILGSGNIVIQGSGGTGNFNELTNRPSYNGTVMSSSTDIPEVPTKTSDLTNDSDFIDSSYHDSSKQNTNDNSLETTDKTIVGSINEVNSIAKQCNRAKGYTNYQTLITELNDASSSVYNVGQSFLIQTLNVPDLWVISVENTSQTYTYTTDAQFITDSSVSGGVQVGYYKLGQLETLKQDLTNYVQNTDYATTSKAGLIRANDNYALSVGNTNGIAYAQVKTYSQYKNGDSYMFISKGTLENVVTGKELVNQTQLNTKQDATDNSLNTDNKTIVGGINEVNSLAKQCNLAKGYTNYLTLINELNSASKTDYNVGQSFLIQTLNVPDLWVYGISSFSVPYTYTTDAAFITASGQTTGVQVGYYRLCQLETLKQDLTNYVTNTDFATASTGGVVRVSNSYGLQLSQGGSLYGLDKTYQEYTDGFNQMLIDKGTLENVVTGKGLVSNTDYATQTTAGVFKTHTYGARVNSNGDLYANSFTNWDNMKDLDSHYFVSKSMLSTALGQLHIVKKTQAQYDALATKDDTALYIIVG